MSKNFENKNVASKYKWPKQEELILLKPLLKQLGNIKNKKILDVGCGTGWITEKLSNSAKKIIAIDISKTMIDLAENNHKKENIDYLTKDLLEFNSNEKFDIVVSALTLHLIKPKTSFVAGLKRINDLLETKGKVVFLVPHPCFSMYNERNYNRFIFDENFNYFNGSQKYTVKLNSDLGNIEFISNFYSLEDYFNMISKAGFAVKNIIEPKVTSELETDYSELWTLEKNLPFYIIFELIKLN